MEYFILYLNKDTWTGDQGELLANTVREVIEKNVPIVMLHETDPDRGGCPFQTFFGTTPTDLIEQHGLYKALAITMCPQPHRVVSLAIVLKALGAKENQKGESVLSMLKRDSTGH
eukprot:CAMPEP_0119341170 /NCGR_PEP_ID=MMETSP1333-20130426/101788_1 /TAXON_ID=418940 /ORGANISM="Scyphosphaera apsteinii, Strain RCC1455" /LENGTH=114 /DNA_ID=CAMNT_0007353073 /DNA_START=33 /DNA_END=374 /DNA_ORIENTATION=-